MTRKDYIAIAGAIADIEFELWAKPEGALTYNELIGLVTDGIAVVLEGDNSRFDRARFELAAQPMLHKAKADRVRHGFAVVPAEGLEGTS